MKWLKRLEQRGDTIVEVLLVTAVLGLVLGSSYAIASRSLKVMRQAQERGEALKLAEGQLEALKAITARDDATTTQLYQTTNRVFCIDAGGTQVTFGNYPGRVPADLLSDDLDAYEPQCQQGFFRMAIELTPVVGDADRFDFVVHVRWDSLGYSARDQVIMRYRMLRDK